MSTEIGQALPLLQDEWELMGERILLSPEVLAQVLARQNPLEYAAVHSVSLASFVRGVRQI